MNCEMPYVAIEESTKKLNVVLLLELLLRLKRTGKRAGARKRVSIAPVPNIEIMQKLRSCRLEVLGRDVLFAGRSNRLRETTRREAFARALKESLQRRQRCRVAQRHDTNSKKKKGRCGTTESYRSPASC